MNANPLQRLQTYWDWRAAGNFICGGAGAGLAVVTTVHAMDTPGARWIVAAGLALVGLGLFCVWLEIGRPLRALNVFLHLRSSWMSREAVAAVVLFLLGSGLVLGMPWRAWPTGIAALVFLYCQARILREARAIPAWRAPLTLPLVMLTGLAEGIGLFWLLAAWLRPEAFLMLPLAGMPIARGALWLVWRRQLERRASPVALRALDRNGRWLLGAGTVAPVTLAALGASGWLASPVAAAALALAGALVAGTGAAFKFCLITRASHHLGYSIPRMPVRGVVHTASH
ncbi:dimethyl sulfoxide reductase anchor subunit [Ramlibacter tataouinensis]|uniref:DmsC/YnfH family molybdoenzyme membrane anchor subunit n=1 Tax=Ramlibacter tataouinensis TaxID=94132 RepID=UPI0022F39D21|nr:DmsC/YnfH family molybdoenzyme membrane anchor subunit [Ramlibacter tataouinensis]WBY03220.1 dimethyl sulfoxide reductase anchor subunit [Ramlibacter tataouinensis]